MMREVLQRRFSRLLKENGARPSKSDAAEARDEEKNGHVPDPAWPDLLLIDGGLGQLNAVRDILSDLGIHDLPLVGVAKGPDRDAGREHFFVPGKESFMLPLRDPVLYFIQRLRDEAHRFAIGTHRAKRSKAISQTGLEDIPGIGPARKRAPPPPFRNGKGCARGRALRPFGCRGNIRTDGANYSRLFS